MIDAGADLILGGHTHCVQPTWKYKSKPIVFSMGNFLFPDRLLNYPRSTYYSETPLELDKLPVTDGYPRYVDTITFKKWKPMARYGLIAIAEISQNRKDVSTKISHLTDDNFLELSSGDYFYAQKVKNVQLALNTGLYSVIMLQIQYLKAIKRYIKKLFKR